MLLNTDPVRAIASQTRSDFEHGLVTDNEVIEAAVAFNSVSWIASLEREKTDRNRRVGIYLVPNHLYRAEMFPKGGCNVATLVVKKRIEAADLLEGNRAELIDGGYGEDTEAIDEACYYHNYHAFLGIGETALGQDTIVDITADQFDARESSVYVGPLREPWTRNPRIELWEY